jgi:hypothetical protein
VPSTSFRFGTGQQHEVRIECGLLGSEKYYVDGALVQRLWSFRMSGLRTFKAHGHEIQVRVKVDLKRVCCEASVDGDLVATDLFAAFNAEMSEPFQVSPRMAGIAAFFLAIGLTTFMVFTYLMSQDQESRQPHDVAQQAARGD